MFGKEKSISQQSLYELIYCLHYFSIANDTSNSSVFAKMNICDITSNTRLKILISEQLLGSKAAPKHVSKRQQHMSLGKKLFKLLKSLSHSHRNYGDIYSAMDIQANLFWEYNFSRLFTCLFLRIERLQREYSL